MAGSKTPASTPQRKTTPPLSPSLTPPSAPTQSATPLPETVAAPPAPIVVPAPPPEKAPLEASIKKTVSDRRDVLVINLRKENEDEVKREEEVRLAKERILKLEDEIAEIDTFLARS